MTSPSPRASTAATTCGNPPVRSWSVRDQIFTRPRSRPATARIPSYFSSNTHSGPSTMPGDSVASIGRMSFKLGPLPHQGPLPLEPQPHQGTSSGIAGRRLRDVTAFVARDPCEESPREHRAGLRRRDVDRGGIPVLPLHEQPPTVAGSHERPRAFQLLAVERKDDATFAERLIECLGVFELVRPDVPHHDRAASVLALRDHALKTRVTQRMVFDGHREALVLRIERRSFGHGPGHEDTAVFEAEVVVESGRTMLLHHAP